MNPQDIINIINNVESLTEIVSDISKDIVGLKIDLQRRLTSNQDIIPGIYPRIAFDKHGLVIHGEHLRAEDIPDISIDQVSGLRKLLRYENIDEITEEAITLLRSLSNKVVTPGTGIKVNYDDKGRIISSSELLASDIPQLSIEHISGLDKRLLLLESLEPILQSEEYRAPINPGTYCKISYDQTGRIIKGSNLSMIDIPKELTERITVLEDRIPLYVTRESFDKLVIDVSTKLKANEEITPGTYTKVTVDKNGLIKFGYDLTIRDLPEINIKDIPTLNTTLKSKANQTDLTELRNLVSTIMSNNQLLELSMIKNQVDTKADQNDIVNINKSIVEVKRSIDQLSQRIPHELFTTELRQLEDLVDTIMGRLVVIEQKLGVHDDFCKIPEDQPMGE